jgi:hypothetical protein
LRVCGYIRDIRWRDLFCGDSQTPPRCAVMRCCACLSAAA